jgi:hypothetical protein
MVDLPESFSYRLKRKLLGKPLVTERLSEERLSNVIALGCSHQTASPPRRTAPRRS